MKPFDKLKVIELASVLAGPAVGMFFAELGAEVTKVENKTTGGDVTRSWKLASEDKNHPFSAYYSSVNYGKKSLFLNLKNTSDFELLCQEIQTAHIIICNFKNGDAEKLKLDYESVKKLNPQIIYGEISGFGKSKRIAYDMVLQAETGFLSMNGTTSGELCKMPVAFIDLFAAHQLKEGILIALLQQTTEKNKKPKKVSVSLYDTALASLANQATNYLMAEHIPSPLGNLHPNIAPYGELFTCRDGKKLVLAVGSNSQFKQLCLVLGLEELISDARFSENRMRVVNRVVLAETLSKKIAAYRRDDLMDIFIEQNVPAGAVRNMAEVFDLNTAKEKIISEPKEGNILKTVKSNSFTISD